MTAPSPAAILAELATLAVGLPVPVEIRVEPKFGVLVDLASETDRQAWSTALGCIDDKHTFDWLGSVYVSLAVRAPDADPPAQPRAFHSESSIAYDGPPDDLVRVRDVDGSVWIRTGEGWMRRDGGSAIYPWRELLESGDLTEVLPGGES